MARHILYQRDTRFVVLGLIHYALKHPVIDWNIIRRGDFVGIISVMLCLGALEVILEKGGEENWLESNMICVLAVISAVSFLIFMYAQLTHAQPLINIRLFRDYNFSCAILVLPCWASLSTVRYSWCRIT